MGKLGDYGDYQIPYDKDGNMVHYYGWGGSIQKESIVFKDNDPFEATLTFIDYKRGRSGHHFILQDEQGHKYPMFIKELMRAIKFVDHGVINGTFCGIKSGSCCSIRVLK